MIPGEDDLLTTPEAAAYLRITSRHLESLRPGGPTYLQPIPRGRVLYRREDLDAWLRGKKTRRKGQAGTQIPEHLLKWGLIQVWEAHLRARSLFFRRQNGAAPPSPTLSRPLQEHIKLALHRHDLALFSAVPAGGLALEVDALRMSAARAAGIGIFYDPWNTGRHKDNDVDQGGKRYLEPERCWQLQRGKPDPVTRFAALYFERRAAQEAARGKDPLAGS